jgi:voltage-gated potassium channel
MSRAFDLFIIALIALNILGVVLETVEQVYVLFPAFFRVFEAFSVIVFTVEYFLRVWSSVENPKHPTLIRGRLRFIITPLALIDLCAILPFYVAGLGLDLRFIRAFRLVRLFRVAKLARYSTSLQALGRVIRAKEYELKVTFFVMFLLLVVASCLMYYAEHTAQPEVFTSIPAAMWWGVTTLTTVGYGDAYPVTLMGKVIASVMALLGIGMFALPAGILGGGFMEEMQRGRAVAGKCPRCGGELRPAQ